MSQPKFKKYSSLENHTRDKFIHSLIQNGMTEGEWVAREKVHGANFSFWYTGGDEDVYTGKRSGPIAGDNFFSSYKLDKYKPAVEITYENLLEAGMLEKGDLIGVYGEIFGGHFFGNQEPGSKAVQAGMNYHPGTEFVAFDIMIFKHDGMYILSDDEMVEHIAEEIPLAPEVGRGEFNDLLMLDNDFQSLIPGIFKLEVPEGEKAQCEGFVMRPSSGDKFLSSGARAIIKHKNKAFNEKGGNKDPKRFKDAALTDEETEIFKKFSVYFNSVRLESVLSKEGEVTWKDFGRVNGLLIQDAMKDFDHDNDFNIKDGDFWGKASKAVGNLAGEVVREYFKKHL
ncbi:RNA ligase [Vibrio phage D148]